MAAQVIMTASGVVKAEGTGCRYYGYDCIVVTATGVINLRDGGSSGTIRASIPAATAAGASRQMPIPIAFQSGIYAEFNGGATGTVGFLVD